jgi:hypothetical protein
MLRAVASKLVTDIAGHRKGSVFKGRTLSRNVEPNKARYR